MNLSITGRREAQSLGYGQAWVRPVPAWAGQVRCQLTPLGVNSSGLVTSRGCFQPLSFPVLCPQGNLETAWVYDTSAGGQSSGCSSGGGGDGRGVLSNVWGGASACPRIPLWPNGLLRVPIALGVPGPLCLRPTNRRTATSQPHFPPPVPISGALYHGHGLLPEVSSGVHVSVTPYACCDRNVTLQSCLLLAGQLQRHP